MIPSANQSCGTQLARDSGVKVRAQNPGFQKTALAMSTISAEHEGGFACGGVSEITPAMSTGLHVYTSEADTLTLNTKTEWLDTFETTGQDAAQYNAETNGAMWTMQGPVSVLKRTVLKGSLGTKSPMNGVKSAHIKPVKQQNVFADKGQGSNSNEHGKTDAQNAGKMSSAGKHLKDDATKANRLDYSVEAFKGPPVQGRKVHPMAGHKRQCANEQHFGQNGPSSTEVLRAMMSKLAAAWKNVGAIFKHFDRPDVEEDGEHKGDCEINLEEFKQGVRELKLDFRDEQIEEVFHIVDVDGSGSIDHSELEKVLQDCGVLKSVAVKRVSSTPSFQRFVGIICCIHTSVSWVSAINICRPCFFFPENFWKHRYPRE